MVELDPARAWSVSDLAARVAADLEPGWSINLGIGMPTAVLNHIDESVWIHSENGILGMRALEPDSRPDPDLVDAGKEPVTLARGASIFDSATSFAMLRGGHIDVAVLGAYQVAANGDLANWKLPGPGLAGIGGAADICSGQCDVWVMTRHTSKDGEAKLVSHATYPLTGRAVVRRVYTELGVFEPKGASFSVRELAKGYTLAQVQAHTGADLEDGR